MKMSFPLAFLSFRLVRNHSEEGCWTSQHDKERYFQVKIKSYSRKLFTVHYSLFTDKNGFTLIETIIVMVLVAILAAVVVIRNPFDSIKLDSAARKVAADIRYVQKLAISNQTRAGMEFNTNGYNVYRDMTGPYLSATSPGDSCSTNTFNNFVVNFTQPRCSNYNGVTITTTLPLSIVKFDSLGTPYDGNNSLLVAGSNTIKLSHSGVTDQTITIEAGTGRVSY